MNYAEEPLADLLAALPPAPRGWVAAAQELPRTRAELEAIMTRVEADQAFRAAVLADLEAALAAEGYEPAPGLMAELQRRLRSSSDSA
jgi:hypothetical protein